MVCSPICGAGRSGSSSSGGTLLSLIGLPATFNPANTALLHLNQHIARCKLRIEEKFVNCVDRRGRQVCFQQDLQPFSSRLFNDLPLDQFFQLLNIFRSQRIGGKTGIVCQILQADDAAQAVEKVIVPAGDDDVAVTGFECLEGRN